MIPSLGRSYSKDLVQGNESMDFGVRGVSKAAMDQTTFYSIMARKVNRRFVDEQHHDEEVQPYILQLMHEENSHSEAHVVESNELMNSARTNDEQNDEAGSSKTRKVRGPTLLKDIWNMPRGKTIDVRFNTRNQAIGKEGRKLASFLGIIARTPQSTPLNIEDWRSFDKNEKSKLVELVRKKFSIPTCGEEFVKKSLGKKWKDYKCDLRSMYTTMYKTRDTLLKNRPNRIPRDQWIGLVSYWLSDKVKKRSQTNRSNRTKQKIPHTGGSKSIGTLMDEQAKDGIEPTRAEVFILTHKKRKDGRPLDEESSKTVDMIQEKLNNERTSTEQSDGSVAWEGDVYTQVFGPEKSGYIRGLGLGPTPSILWGNKSLSGNISRSNMSNDMLQRSHLMLTVVMKEHPKHHTSHPDCTVLIKILKMLKKSLLLVTYFQLQTDHSVHILLSLTLSHGIAHEHGIIFDVEKSNHGRFHWGIKR
ncbi:uncharacterized protein LOC130719563 [Lotus japonicus]|uniref:uncharacterized protein LOC130719563 n=1 Tax=Lotus japonicus TaxID=34305 RepID=UPI00258586EE|nr:uncharacterized protein LOC130719563 [Lotus japonicus]